jgi:hypothetical protein
MECPQPWHTFAWLPRGSGLCDGRRAQARAPTHRSPPFVTSIHHQLSLSSPPSIMSADPSTSTSNSDFASIFNAALKTYKHKTKKDLTSHPLLPRLQSCNSPEAILTALREQIPASDQSQNGDDGLTKWVSPTVNVLYAFSATVGQGVGLVCIGIFGRGDFRFNIYYQAFRPANAIFAGISVLLLVGILYVSLAQTI